MKGLSTELKVGVFALMVLAVLSFMTFRVGGLDWAKKKGYTLFVYFRNTAGLDEKTQVKISGVDAGFVEGIDLVEGRARVRLRINPDIRIYRNGSASIKSLGLLGDKFMAISVGTSDFPLMKDGDTIGNVTEVVDVDELARKLMDLSRNFGDLSRSLNEVFGTEEAKESLSQTIVNLREVTAGINRTIDENDMRLRNALDRTNSLLASLNDLVDKNSENFTGAVSDMRDFSARLKKDGPELVDDLSSAAKELRAMVEENRAGVKSAVDSIDNIARRIDQGEGSIGKLVKDDRLYESVNKAAEGVNKTISAVDRFRTFIGFQADYLTKPAEVKGSFNVTLQPRKDKYYILGVVGDPLGSVRTKETVTTPPGTVVKEEEIEEKIEFTAQIARRFGDAALRIGLTENTFGVGGDYFFDNDRVRVTADVWDFGNDEEGSGNPHVKAGLDYFLFKDLFISAGADNIFNKKWRGGYVGMGLRFEDEDFKYLMGTLPKVR